MRGFGIDAGVPVEVAVEVAEEAEQLGYGSFWVNGSPPHGALEVITAVAGGTGLDLGVGVFPLTRISVDELISEVRGRDIPQDRLWLGVGSGREKGALAEVRQAVEAVRRELEVTVVTGAVGPRMTALAGEIADAVLFTWWIASEVERSRAVLNEAAERAGRHPPLVISYVRCALMPQAAEALAERAEAYGAIPRYKEVFARNRIGAADTVVTGSSREELLEGIAREEAVLDRSVIRAIPAENTVAALSELARACAP